MSTQTSKAGPGEFVQSMGGGVHPSLVGIRLAPTAVDLQAGTVLGRITATGAWGPYSAGATDGRQVALGILHSFVPASTSTQRAGAVVRDARVTAAALIGLDAATVANFRDGSSVLFTDDPAAPYTTAASVPIRILVN